ncbi:MAG TPA: hypothetical protein VGL91_04020 [Acidobacteriota bacterium]|jgi:protein ImuB
MRRRYGAVFLQSDQKTDLPARALETAGAFSPWVEIFGASLVLMDLSGLEKQWPEEKDLAAAIQKKFEAENLCAQVAIASNPITAKLIARGRAGINIAPDGQEKQFLAPLPLELLDLPPELWEVFDRWGLHTLGDLARLPENSLTARLGERGLEFYYQARGQDNKPLTPLIPAEIFEDFYAFDWPLENSEPLAFIVNHLLERLCARLTSNSLRAEAAELSLKLADRTENTRLLRFGFPLNDPPTILSLLRLDLEARPPQAGIASLLLRLYPTAPRPMQFSLIDPPLPAPEKLARTLARLAALVGEQNVGSPALLNTHRPDAFEMKPFEPHIESRRSPVAGRRSKVASRRLQVSGCKSQVNKSAGQVEGQRGCSGLPIFGRDLLTCGPDDLRPATCDLRLATCDLQPATCDLRLATGIALALRLFRPPLPAQVNTDRMRPAAVEASKIRGRVLECGGPWRSSGDWWENQQRWARDEWDVLLSNGAVYRLYRDLQADSWFIYGIYD